MACLCCRCVADHFARNSGCCAALRPASKFSFVTATAHLWQWRLPLRTSFPHPRQTLSGFGALTDGTSLPLTERFRLCVRRVAISCRASLDVVVGLDTEDQVSCATYSATGATSLRHVSEVSQSLIASDDARRQFPLRSSQKSDLRSGSL